jgi:hypothetical protein
MPKSVLLRARLDSATFGGTFTVRQDGAILPRQTDGTYLIDFMKLRLDVSPGTSALSASRPVPRAIRAAALRASLRSESRPLAETRLLDGKAVSRNPAAGVRVEMVPAENRSAR